MEPDGGERVGHQSAVRGVPLNSMSDYSQQEPCGAGDRPAAAQPVESPGLLRVIKRRLMAIVGYLQFLRGLVSSYSYDIRRYHRAASKGNEAVRAGKPRYVELRSWIAADAHKIEKGLALRSPRPGFGKAVVRRLLEQVEWFHRDFGPEYITEVAINTLVSYCDFAEAHDAGSERIRARVDALIGDLDTARDCDLGGTIALAHAEVLRQAKVPGLAEFFQSRYSIRNFSDAPVSADAVDAAIVMAQKTPSVCNRQSWKAYVFLEHDAAQQVLACQQGNRGFGDTAAGVVVITSDLRTFFSYGERNQGFIDGGMFAMSVVYGLHAQGLGSCCLNWCAELSAERKLRAVAEIPHHEAVIMMIAIGHLPESLDVAQSVRKPLDDVRIHGRLRSQSETPEN